jgi:hypothetical protein
LTSYVRNAEFESSELVLCEGVSLGDDPELKVCAALRLREDGVELWAALIGDASPDREEVLEIIGMLRQEMPEVEIQLAEFVPAPRIEN